MTTPCQDDPTPFDVVIETEHKNRKSVRRERAVDKCRDLCRACPITDQCLEDNLRAAGIIAGLTLRQRSAIGRLKPCGTVAAYDRHRRRGEAPCFACRMVKAEEMKGRRERAEGAA